MVTVTPALSLTAFELLLLDMVYVQELISQEWRLLVFPQRDPVDVTYRLSPAYKALFDAVYDFCTEIVRSGAELQEHRRRMRWWNALALLRCVMSSPRAARVADALRRSMDAADYKHVVLGLVKGRGT